MLEWIDGKEHKKKNKYTTTFSIWGEENYVRDSIWKLACYCCCFPMEHFNRLFAISGKCAFYVQFSICFVPLIEFTSLLVHIKKLTSSTNFTLRSYNLPIFHLVFFFIQMNEGEIVKERERKGKKMKKKKKCPQELNLNISTFPRRNCNSRKHDSEKSFP